MVSENQRCRLMLNLRRKASGRFSRPCFSALFLFPDQTEKVIGENIFQFRPGEMLGKDSAQVHAGAAYREIAAEKGIPEEDAMKAMRKLIYLFVTRT